MYTDPIADLLTRIRNSYLARKESLVVPHSTQKMAILEALKKRNFISEYKKAKNDKFDEIAITLNPELHKLTLNRISKAGKRMYIKSRDIKKIRGGLGIAIISTSKGVMSGEEAKEQNLGGEYLCEVY